VHPAIVSVDPDAWALELILHTGKQGHAREGARR
jgi:hypothetical protein